MATCATAIFLLLLLLTATTTIFSSLQERELLQIVQTHVSHSKTWVQNSLRLHRPAGLGLSLSGQNGVVALGDCDKLYEESESRIAHMLSEKSIYDRNDAVVWVSGLMANHRTCLDGLEEKGYTEAQTLGKNLTMLLGEALALYSKGKDEREGPAGGGIDRSNGGLLLSWNPATAKADFIVAQDGSGTHRTIREAVAALAARGDDRQQRAIIHVKSGVYSEKVEIGNKLKNVMFVGDGIDKTIVTGSRNVIQGATTLSSATFDVSGDGFWARDMTFENTAGPAKHQAVALKVSSDLSVFYRCSIKAYQDTLYVHSNRQFYRDCHIYGTIDFIFGDAAAMFQNSDILVRKPMDHQSNLITAQARDDPNEPTGISIQNCCVRPALDLAGVMGSFKTYLGRPWKKYSRTVFLKTDLDGFVDPTGWKEWNGSFALSTLYYAEYMNSGSGASTTNRVNWPGFHVLHSADEAMPFTVRQFLQGHRWIPSTGVPFSDGI